MFAPPAREQLGCDQCFEHRRHKTKSSGPFPGSCLSSSKLICIHCFFVYVICLVLRFNCRAMGPDTGIVVRNRVLEKSFRIATADPGAVRVCNLREALQSH
jgi:hypothetical protein